MSNPTDALAARNEEEIDPHFEPVIKLTEQVDTKTGEEQDDVIFKLRSKLFRFDSFSSEWKERGTGDVRLLQNKESKKVRLVMRREKTLKVCANHSITSDMHLQPNIGSDRSWVWKVAADYSENPPTAETLAIRFANSAHAAEFKAEFEKAQRINASTVAASEKPKVEEPDADNIKSEDPSADSESAAEKLEEAAEKGEDVKEKGEAEEAAETK